jgi:Fe-S-cluster containining protein
MELLQPVTVGLDQLTRQQRRDRDREHQRQFDALARDGIPPSADLTATVVLTRHLAQILATPGDERRASRAAEAAERIYDVSIRRHPARQAIACGKGCSYCCRNFVAVSIPEVLFLARGIRERWPDATAAIRGRIAETARRPRDLGKARQAASTVPCPVLDGDGACSAYDIRPLACRAYVSISVDACIRAMADPSIDIPTTKTQVFYRARCTTALWAALKAVRLPYGSYDLNHALAVAAATEDAEARWLAGEDVFAAVQIDPSRKADVEPFLDRLIAEAAT